MITKKLAILVLMCVALYSCSGPASNEEVATSTNEETTAPAPGQSAVQDETSDPNILNVALGSPDHTTLVAAVQAADLVDALANAGPFTVFAPVNSAFDALPEGTVESLLKPENKDQLKQILLSHVLTSALAVDYLGDGKEYAAVDENFTRWMITKKDGKTYINGAEILGSVRASNGYVHVIDKVLLAQ